MITFLPTTTGPAPLDSETLAPGEVRALHLHPGQSLHVTEGLLWLTRSNDPADHLLPAGHALSFPRPALVVIQALRTPARYNRLP
ncbi:MAG: DUF2917 domain-containing protein [Phycisphaerae bacterium]